MRKNHQFRFETLSVVEYVIDSEGDTQLVTYEIATSWDDCY